jgi:hypothetical protein
MSRRILVVTCISLAAVCLTMVALMGIQAARAERQAAMANERLADAMMQAKLVQAEMLKKLDEMSKAAQSPRSADWIPVTFHLSDETGAGSPAANFRVSLGRGTNGSNRGDAIRRVSTETGIVDCGVVQPGDWEYSLIVPGEQGEFAWTATGTLNVVPGTTIEQSIICPKPARTAVTIRPRVKWPADLADKNLVLCAQFQHMGLTFQPPLTWTTGGFFWEVFLGPEPDTVYRFKGTTLYFWQLGSLKKPRDLMSAPFFAEARGWDPPLEVAENSGWQRGDYHLTKLVVLQPTTTASPDRNSRRFHVLGYAAGPVVVDALYVFEKPPDENADPNAPLSGPPSMTLGPKSPGVLELTSNSTEPKAFRFSAEEGKLNEWTIPLPEQLLQALREKLKVPGAATKK